VLLKFSTELKTEVIVKEPVIRVYRHSIKGILLLLNYCLLVKVVLSKASDNVSLQNAFCP
jgi:hypothetical protein